MSRRFVNATSRNAVQRHVTFRQEERDARIFDMWLACYTQEEIAEAEDVAEGTIANRVSDFLNFGQVSKNEKTFAEHLADFDPPIYNIWKQQNKSNSVSHSKVVFSTVPVRYRNSTSTIPDTA